MISLLLCRFIVKSHVASWRCYDEAEPVFMSCTNTVQRNAVVRTNFIMVSNLLVVLASRWNWYTATITWIVVPAPMNCNTVYGRIPYQAIFYKR